MINENDPQRNSAVISRRDKIISATAAGLGVISLPVLIGIRSHCDSKEGSNECNDDVNQKLATILAAKSLSLGMRYFYLNGEKIRSYFNANNVSDQARSDLESDNSQQFTGNQNIQVSELAQSQSVSQNSEASERRSLLISMTSASMGLVSFAALMGSRAYCGSSADDFKECSNEVNEKFATALAINGVIMGARYFYNNTRGILSELRESSNANNESDQVRADLVVAQPTEAIELRSSQPITGTTRDQARGENS
jgi:hypothetical protein